MDTSNSGRDVIERTDLAQAEFEERLRIADGYVGGAWSFGCPIPLRSRELTPGTVLEWRGRNRAVVSARKKDDTGWWLEGGSGLADHVFNDPANGWCVISQPLVTIEQWWREHIEKHQALADVPTTGNSADTGNPKDAIGDTKPQLHLVPSALAIHAALAMKNGADKYGPYNWREKQVRATVYLSAAFRHLYAFLDGEDHASDSGVHHLGHAAAGIGILLDAIATGNLIDDRPVAGAAARLLSEHTERAA